MTREEAETKFGQVWNTEELQRDFEVRSFLAPLVMVIRKSDRKPGTLIFDHSPRWYFRFMED